MKKSPLQQYGKSNVSKTKVKIQALLRELAIQRDKHCVLQDYPEAGVCGSRATKDGHLIIQAEHLISRARSVSFADMRNIVLLCQRHHGYFKEQNGRLYWELIEKIIGQERWNWIKKVEKDTKPYHMDLADWQKIEIVLYNELQKRSEERRVGKECRS